MNHYQINSLLYGTNSIFHNKGLCIYGIKTNKVKMHEMVFIDEAPRVENVRLTNFETYLETLTDLDFKKTLSECFQNATETFNSLGVSAARIGVLASHKNLIDGMRPHIHRQAYAHDVRPTVTIHYRISGSLPSVFEYYDSVDRQEIIAKNLCDNTQILEWSQGKIAKELYLPDTKNIIIFDSATVPHSVKHGENLDLYFVFDNIIFKENFVFHPSKKPQVFNGEAVRVTN